MNIYLTNAHYMRLAALALCISFCGQTKCAGDRVDLGGVLGAALAGVSVITRLAIDPLSALGLALDATCFATNSYAVCGGKPYKPLAIVEAGCIFGLILQHTRLVPALILGANDPLRQIRPALSLISGLIIGTRFWNNYVHPQQN